MPPQVANSTVRTESPSENAWPSGEELKALALGVLPEAFRHKTVILSSNSPEEVLAFKEKFEEELRRRGVGNVSEKVEQFLSSWPHTFAPQTETESCFINLSALSVPKTAAPLFSFVGNPSQEVLADAARIVARHEAIHCYQGNLSSNILSEVYKELEADLYAAGERLAEVYKTKDATKITNVREAVERLSGFRLRKADTHMSGAIAFKLLLDLSEEDFLKFHKEDKKKFYQDAFNESARILLTAAHNDFQRQLRGQ